MTWNRSDIIIGVIILLISIGVWWLFAHLFGAMLSVAFAGLTFLSATGTYAYGRRSGGGQSRATRQSKGARGGE